MSRSLKPSLWWAIFPALVALLVVIDRPRPGRPAHQAEWLTAGDTKLRSVRAGTGDTTLLLLHGFGESLFTWRSIYDQLATRYRVVAVDLPGFGGSGKPDGPYTLDAMTARLSDLIDRSIEGPLVVVGHSMGGELTAALALARPDRVNAAVLIAPAGWNVGLGGIADTMYPGKARAIGWYLSSRAFVLPEHDPDWLGEPDSAASYTLVGDSVYRKAAARVLEEFDFRALRDSLTGIQQPILLLWGTRDPVIPYAIADSMAKALPCNTLKAFEGAFHRPQAEIPDPVAKAIMDFAANPTCSTDGRKPH